MSYVDLFFNALDYNLSQLYMWHYNRRGETSSPVIVLKTRRSLRAVHFHPHAAPFLLTAEVTIFGGIILPCLLAFRDLSCWF